MENRESFKSRAGFILTSAGCAIGLGNVYRFPIITGANGGAIFVLFYLFFLVALAMPLMACEMSVGRASRKSIAKSYETLEKSGQKWHLTKYIGIAGNYLLLMFYTCVTGWFVNYFVRYLDGSAFQNHTASQLSDAFASMTSSTSENFIFTFIIIIFVSAVCGFGLKKGVEKISKWMLSILFVLIIAIVVYCLTLPGTGEGLRFYFFPDFSSITFESLKTTMVSAMGQAFFTTSVGIGTLATLASYSDRNTRLLKESMTVISLDTFVAIMSGLIIFPAFFTFNSGATIEASQASPQFIFTTLSGIFNNMEFGRIIGAMFFLFMSFAALSTIIAVFEVLNAVVMDLTGLGRIASTVINCVLLCLLSLPTIFTYSQIAGMGDFTIFGYSIPDLEDFLVSNVALPLGALIYVLFCTRKLGWGWDNFLLEVNHGKGLRLSSKLRIYVTWFIPVIILFIFALNIFG